MDKNNFLSRQVCEGQNITRWQVKRKYRNIVFFWVLLNTNQVKKNKLKISKTTPKMEKPQNKPQLNKIYHKIQNISNTNSLNYKYTCQKLLFMQPKFTKIKENVKNFTNANELIEFYENKVIWLFNNCFFEGLFFLFHCLHVFFC